MAGLDIKLNNIDNEDSAALAEMTGAIDGNTVPSFQSTLEEIKTRGIRRLVLDMSKIKYVNSTGLGSLVKYADSFKSSGGGMALIKVPAKVKIVIEMLGLNAFFDICTDLNAALEALKNAGTAEPAPAADTKASSSAVPPRATRKKEAAPAPAAAPAATGSGQVVACQGCGVSLELPGSGNWKCPRCYSFVSVDASGGHSFTNTSGPVPLNLSLTASQDCGEGLVHLVTSVCSQAFNGQKLQDLRVAVHEIAQVMSQSIYPNNPTGIYHVCIEREPGSVQIRFSDSGTSVASQYFPNASRSLTEFDCRPHPSGGNMIKLVQRN
jgi:anti-sigma B factor antagonist